MEKRRLVGRRYEDYLRNGIHIELSREEHLFRMFLADPRYSSQLDRRQHIRRESDRPPSLIADFFRQDSALAQTEHILSSQKDDQLFD